MRSDSDEIRRSQKNEEQEAYKTDGIGTCANYGVFVINWLRNAGAGLIEYASN